MTAVGVALRTRYPDGVPARDHVLACAEAASDGAAFFWIGDKRRPPRESGTYLHNVTTLAWLLPRLGGVARVGSLFLTASWPLDLMLEQIDTLRDLAGTDGRGLDVVLALGRPDTATEGRSRVQALEDAIAALSGSSHAGREVWIAAERGRALERAGRTGGAWLANATYSRAELAEQAEIVVAARPAASRDRPLGVRRDLMCLPDDEQAREEAASMLAGGYRRGMTDDHLLVGSPATCAQQVRELAAIGFTHVAVRPMPFDPDIAASSLSAFLTEVQHA